MRPALTTIFAVLVLSAAAFAAKPESLTVGVGQTRAIHGVRVTFDKLVEDSRCPMNARCIWAGNAEIQLTISRGRSKQTVTLNTGEDPRTVTAFGYTFSIDDLTPWPGGPKGPRRVRLEVDRAPGG